MITRTISSEFPQTRTFTFPEGFCSDMHVIKSMLKELRKQKNWHDLCLKEIKRINNKQLKYSEQERYNYIIHITITKYIRIWEERFSISEENILCRKNMYSVLC